MVAPIAFFTMFAVLEFGLMMFDLGSTRFAAEEGAKVEAQAGNKVVKCTDLPGCQTIFPGGPGNPNCDADCQAIVTINNTALGTTKLEQVNEIDIEKLSSDGKFQPLSPRVYNAFNLNGQLCSSGCSPHSNYPSSTRDTTLGTADYLAVTIVFTYNWETGLFNQFAKPKFTVNYDVRLEPQRFPAQGP